MAHPQSRLGGVSQLDGIHRQGETPKTPASPTIEQLLRGPDGSRWSLRSTQSFGREHHDMEEDHTPTHRKSVLSKVKEKAKKWRSTLSKKKHNEDSNATPSWGVSLEDEDEEDEDPEYLGAPSNKRKTKDYLTVRKFLVMKHNPWLHPGTTILKLVDPNIKSCIVEEISCLVSDPWTLLREYEELTLYESEMAPEGYKETARQHPRAIPVVSEKHILTSSVSTAKSVRTTPSPRSGSRTTTTFVTPKAAPKTISETVAEKLAPAYATVTEATYAIASKIQSLAISSPESQVPPPTAPNPPATTPISPKSPAKSSLPTYPHVKTSLATVVAAKSSEPATPSPRARALTPQAPAPVATKQQEVITRTETEKAAPVSAPAAVTNRNGASATEQIWDKGVSVKEYIMHKLEPGEDEKALSQVISQAISPKKGPGDASVVEKVKEAVTSLLRIDESSQVQQQQQQRLVFHSAQNSSSNIPISTNAHEVVEEETHGRILQAN